MSNSLFFCESGNIDKYFYFTIITIMFDKFDSSQTWTSPGEIRNALGIKSDEEAAAAYARIADQYETEGRVGALGDTYQARGRDILQKKRKGGNASAEQRLKQLSE